MNEICEEYYNHRLFSTLHKVEKFYDDLSFNCFKFISASLITKVWNLDDSIYQAIAGTIESIEAVLKDGHINDAYTLLRKYDDAILVDTYKSILLKHDNDAFIKEMLLGAPSEMLKKSKLRQWTLMSKRLYGNSKDIEKEIDKDEKLCKVMPLMREDDSRYDIRRKICNNNVHYNSWKFFVLNDKRMIESGSLNWKKYLDNIERALIQFFATHFSYIYVLHFEYFMASDYMDYLDCGSVPPKGAQYWISKFIQDAFDELIKPYYPKLSAYLISLNLMELK